MAAILDVHVLQPEIMAFLKVREAGKKVATWPTSTQISEATFYAAKS
jgi:hypothetical protein